MILDGRPSARYAHVDSFKIGRDAGWPRISKRPKRRNAFTGTILPALAHQFRKCERSVAVDDRLDVMIRGVWFARGIDPYWIVEVVLNGVPASDRHVLPAAEGNRIVHHDDLLVMRRAGRQIIVQTVANPVRHAPTQPNRGTKLALQREQHGVIPDQEIHPELRPFIDQCTQKIDEHFGIPVIRSPALTDEPRAAIDIPADHEYRRTRLQQGFAQCAEIARGIDQHCGAIGLLNTPTVMI